MPPTVTSKGAIFRRFRQCRRTEICTVVRTTEGRRIDGTRNNRTPADFERDTGNNGLPIGREPFASPGTSPAALPYREPDAITAYRNNYTTPDYPLQDGKGTIAITELDGKPIFGMNSSAPGYTPEDRAAADEMRTILREKYPEAIRSDNVSGKPFDLVYHAEATALLRTARTNGGTLQGVTLDMYVDRTMCWSCEDLLPKLGFEIGNPTVWFRDRLGMRRRMRDGAWE